VARGHLRRAGASWGPILTAAAEPDHICWNFPGPPLETCSIGQPTPILDKTTGVVHLLFARDNKQVFSHTRYGPGKVIFMPSRLFCMSNH
jgi:hypothetical protein